MGLPWSWLTSLGADSSDDAGRTRIFNNVFQDVDVGGGLNRIINRRVDRVQIRLQFVGLDRNCIRRVDDVFIPHFKIGCQEIARWVAEVQVVDDRNNRPDEFGAVDAEGFGNVAGFASIDIDRCGISLPVG